MLAQRLSNLFWKIVSVVYYQRIFGSAGHTTWIRRPMALINPKQIYFGQGCFVRDGARLEVVNRPGLPAARMTIGDRVSIEQGVHIVASDSVEIGDDVCIAPRCTIVGATHPIGSSDSGNRVGSVTQGRSSIKIGDRVFLGANVVVLANVSIGANTIVGAGSVVTKDLPANAICVGSPAKPVKFFDEQGLTLALAYPDPKNGRDH
jgi:acetyltransferase-like isoleucine patch superfamily enzyme